MERTESAWGEELHNTLCQTLAGATFLAEVLLQDARKEKEENLHDLRKLKAALKQAVEEIQFIMKPSVLLSNGLLDALSQLALRVSLRTPCRFQTKLDHLPIDDRKSRVLYRLAKTVVTFLARGGGEISMRLSGPARGGPFRLTILQRLSRPSVGQRWNKSDIMVMRACALAVGIKPKINDSRRSPYRVVFNFKP